MRTLGCTALVISLLLFVWLMGGAVAYGWLLHADHYGAPFAAFAKWYFACAGGMTIAVILYLCKRDLIAAILGTACWIPMLTILLKAMNLAEINNWSGQTERSFARNASEVWRNGMMWNAVPLILLLALTLTRYFSYDAAVRRKNRRQKREEIRNAPAQSILEDSEGS